MRMVRMRQQEIANERARQAAAERKAKEAAERERRNTMAKKKLPPGDKLGSVPQTTKSNSDSTDRSSSGESCSYNPMQPWTGHSS